MNKEEEEEEEVEEEVNDGVNQRNGTIGPLMDVTKLREVRCGNPRNKPILQDWFPSLDAFVRGPLKQITFQNSFIQQFNYFLVLPSTH